MNISQNGVNFIKQFEGLRLHAYKPVPTEKYWTIGYGHYGSDVKANQQITAAGAEELLKKDLKKYVDGVKAAVKVTLNQNQFDALVSFAYNCGIGALGDSTLLKRVNANDFEAAANEFFKWNKGGGKELPGLTRRRNAERNLFLTAVKEAPRPPQPVFKTYYIVRSGDTVSEIATKYKTTIDKIKALNHLDSKYTIKVGQRLRVK